MGDDLYSFALKNTLEEIRNLCPDISSTFMFSEDGEITASDGNTPETSIVRVIDAFKGVLEKAETMGGIELITIEGSKGGANVSRMSSRYFVAITSEKADENYVNIVTRSIVTTVLKLLDKINPAPPTNNPPETETQPKPLTDSEKEPAEQLTEHPAEKLVVEEPEVKEAKQPEQPIQPEIEREEPTANQFMVENIGGLSVAVAPDTVRVDKETLSQWEEAYGNLRIEEVEIVTFGGQSTRCKIKPIKDSKQEGKGLVQIPQRIQQMLEVKKGELVKVKPVVEQEGSEQ
jgi:hypothetical protein